MKPNTEELLYLLLWSCETLAQPTWRNLSGSFESWAYRKGFLRQIQRLEQAKLLEGSAGTGTERLYRLTEAGTTLSIGGRDPSSLWKRRWDGRWRLVVFDVPQVKAGARAKLRRYLRSRGFGFLQNSVWITPDPLTDERELLAGGSVSVESLILLEAHPCAGESEAEIVAGAWDFERINHLYTKHAEVLARRPRATPKNETAARTLRKWLLEERQTWFEAVTADPLLPECLHPQGYRGVGAWRARLRDMGGAATQIRSFTEPA